MRTWACAWRYIPLSLSGSFVFTRSNMARTRSFAPKKFIYVNGRPKGHMVHPHNATASDHVPMVLCGRAVLVLYGFQFRGPDSYPIDSMQEFSQDSDPFTGR